MLIVGVIGALGLLIFSAWFLLVVKDENKRKAPLIGATICLLLALGGLTMHNNSGSSPTAALKGKPDYEKNYGNVAIAYKIQKQLNEEGKTQIIVTTKNVGSNPFSGTVDIKSTTPEGVYLDMEILHIFNLAPDKSRVSICWVKISKPPHVKVVPNSN